MMTSDRFNRELPHSVQIEQALLGAMLTKADVYDRVQDTLRPEHFAVTAHGTIFKAIRKIHDRGHVADAAVVHRLFKKMNALEDVGGAEYLVGLLDSVISYVNTPHYAELIYDYFRRRELIALAEDAIEVAYEEDPDKTAATHIDELEEGLYQLSDDGSGGGDPVHILEALKGALAMAKEARESDGEVVGVATGLTDLDRLLGGLRDTNLYILAGRPAMGKTALATNIAYNASEHGPVGFFSLEMSKEQLAQRIQSDEAQINSHDINLGNITEMDFLKLGEVSEKIGRRALYVDDTPAINTSQLRARARRMQRRHGVSLIVIDYLQLLEPVGMGRNDGPVAKTTAISKALKALAKELRVPVIALSQLNRSVEMRDPPKPILSDLRESGSIEQDADVVMFIYREEYYYARKKPEQREGEDAASLADRMFNFRERMDQIKNLAEIIVAKQRHGPVGNCMLSFDGPTCRFRDKAREGY
jgi:replicative DNA helicase